MSAQVEYSLASPSNIKRDCILTRRDTTPRNNQSGYIRFLWFIVTYSSFALVSGSNLETTMQVIFAFLLLLKMVVDLSFCQTNTSVADPGPEFLCPRIIVPCGEG